MGSLGLGYYIGEEHPASKDSPTAAPAQALESTAAPAPSGKRVISLPQRAPPKQPRSHSPTRQFTLLANIAAYHTPYPPLQLLPRSPSPPRSSRPAASSIDLGTVEISRRLSSRSFRDGVDAHLQELTGGSRPGSVEWLAHIRTVAAHNRASGLVTDDRSAAIKRGDWGAVLGIK